VLIHWLHQIKLEKKDQKIIKGALAIDPIAKRLLEIIGVPHTVATNEFVILTGDNILALIHTLGLFTKTNEELTKLIEDPSHTSTFDVVKKLSDVKLRDKSGVFIGSRMGRPEKAKMRKMKGSPHTLFPVGDEGGRMRSFQAALQIGKIKSNFPLYHCAKCDQETVFSMCELCDTRTKRKYFCSSCGVVDDKKCERHGDSTVPYVRKEVDINKYFKQILKKLGMNVYPDLIKGVRGTSNKEHIPEHLVKGILRAKHNIHVNKDGTVRYDCSELPITHFKPFETRVSVERLRELGYTEDIKKRPLERDDQIVELKPQDVLLPCCPDSPEEGADAILYRTTKFIDELLESWYGLPPFYNLTSPDDLVGHLTIGLAPHTSAGSLFRIIGFTKTQAFFCHPLMHAAMRRDCDGDESCLFLLLDAFLNFSKKYLPSSRGSTMDAPLVLTSILAPTEVDDMVFDIDIVWKYPLEFYEAAEKYMKPWDIKIKQIKDTLNTPEQYEGMGFTHDTTNINAGVLCSAYKTLPSMQEKLTGQMDLAEKMYAVDEADVARLVIEKHFIRDIKGNLRKFSMQEFRCVNCNCKFRRPPLVGSCTACGGKIIFTISEGSIVKYLQPSISLAEKYNLSTYLKQTLEITQRRIEGVFGREKERQEGLGKWFG